MIQFKENMKGGRGAGEDRGRTGYPDDWHRLSPMPAEQWLPPPLVLLSVCPSVCCIVRRRVRLDPAWGASPSHSSSVWVSNHSECWNPEHRQRCRETARSSPKLTSRKQEKNRAKWAARISLENTNSVSVEQAAWIQTQQSLKKHAQLSLFHHPLVGDRSACVPR